MEQINVVFEYPVFFARVMRFVDGVSKLPEHEFEARLYDDVKDIDEVKLMFELYDMTVDELKEVFDRKRCPTWEDLENIPGVGTAGGDEQGTYVGMITPVDGRQSDPNRLYCGTGSSIARGVSGRAAQKSVIIVFVQELSRTLMLIWE